LQGLIPKNRSTYRYMKLFKQQQSHGPQAEKVLGRRPLVPHALRPLIQKKITDYASKGCRVTSRLTTQIAQDQLKMRGMHMDLQRRCVQRLNTSMNLRWRRATTGHVQKPLDVNAAKAKFIEALQDHHKIVDDLVFNLDETSIWLSNCSSYTMAPRGSRNVSLVGSDKRCVTGLVTSTASGKILKCSIVWKGTTERCHVNGQVDGVYQTHSHNKWSNGEITCQHIRECILPEIAAICAKTKGFVPNHAQEFPSSLLLVDCWKGHWEP